LLSRIASFAERCRRSQSLRAAVMFAGGGLGFAVGNIVLAMVLPSEQFGDVALLLALNQFCLTFGTLGMETVLNRHRPPVDWRLGGPVLSAAGLSAAAAAAIATRYYGLSGSVAGILFVLVAASTVNRVGSALFQEQRKVGMALGLLQIHNYTLLLASGAVLLVNERKASLVLGVVAAGYLLTAFWGWWHAHRTLTGQRSAVPAALMLREGLAVVGLNVAVQTLFQFERLAIPKVGDMAMLGTYAVLAAVAGSPYRMIQLGNSFTLLPRMRAAPDAVTARAVIGAELAMAAIVSVVSSGAVLLLAPWIFASLLHGKYVIGPQLLAVAIAIGLVRVWEGFSTTIVAALGDSRGMARMSVLGWLSLAVAGVGVLVGSRDGLVGILCGVLAAWVVLAASGSALAYISFQRRFSN